MSDGQNSNSETNKADKKFLDSDLGKGILIAIIAAGGATLGSYLTGSKLVESTTVPALINARTICIDKVNEDEKKFREKASSFLAALAAFDADILFKYQGNNKQLYDSAKLAITQAMSISSYSSEHLAVLAISISASIRTLAMADMDDGVLRAAYKTLSSSIGEWPKAYEVFMETFDTKRANCNTNYSLYQSRK